MNAEGYGQGTLSSVSPHGKLKCRVSRLGNTAIPFDTHNSVEGLCIAIGGSAVSASFLFAIGLANAFILARIMRRRLHRRRKVVSAGCPAQEDAGGGAGGEGGMLMMRILGPLTRFVDRPWKMYPVGVLFGLGFDTASSIALLAVSAIAKRGADAAHGGNSASQGSVVIFPFLFTAGMSLVDSTDSVLMLYSYAGFAERRHMFRLFAEPPPTPQKTEAATNWVRPSSREGTARSTSIVPETAGVEQTGTGTMSAEGAHHIAHTTHGISRVAITETSAPVQETLASSQALSDSPISAGLRELETGVPEVEALREAKLNLKTNTMSTLGIVLTFISIAVAFSVSVVTIMGLVGDNCKACREAAEANNGHGGGLAGRWWRAWAKANDASGFIGAAIVGCFLFIVCIWYAGFYATRKLRRG